MVGRERHSFYESSVEAKAAYILDKDGYVLARAILFTDVKDEDGNNGDSSKDSTPVNPTRC